LVFCGILLLLFVVIHFGFLRYAHHFGAIPFGSLADVSTKKRPTSIPKDIIVEIYKVVGNYRRQ